MCLTGQRHGLWSSRTISWGSAVCSLSLPPHNTPGRSGAHELKLQHYCETWQLCLLLHCLTSQLLLLQLHKQIPRFYLQACSLALMESVPLFAIIHLCPLYGEETFKSTGLPRFGGWKIVSAGMWYFGVTTSRCVSSLTAPTAIFRRKKGESLCRAPSTSCT